MKSERNYGIDLLRILLTFFICTLHILGHGGVLEASKGTFNYYVFWIFEALAVCAVDGYALISGYIYHENKNNYKRIIFIAMETFFYSFVVTILLRIFNIGEHLNILDLLKTFFPIITNYFWYITAFFPLFFLMPYINKGINCLDEEETKKLLIFLFVLFSIVGSIQDNYSTYGMSFVWLAILFSMGVIIKKINFLGSLSKTKLILIFFISTFLTWFIKCAFDILKIFRNISPTVLISAMALVILFSKFNINSKVVKFISPLCLGIYLFQENNIIRENFIVNHFIFASCINPITIPIFVLLAAFCLFFVCTIVDFIRSLLFKLIHAEQIAEFINKIFNNILNMVSSKITNRQK